MVGVIFPIVFTFYYWEGNTVKQASFHAHLKDDKHHGISDWEITLVDQTDSVDYELDTFQPNGLNEHDAAFF